MRNRTLLQFFEWYLPADSTLWNTATDSATSIADLKITDIWLPPAYKCANGKNDVGYGVYDMYDLGEFNQKGTLPTKYGTKAEYLRAIKSLQNAGLKVHADVVFNHRMGADDKERIMAQIINSKDRTQVISEREIDAWTVFNFPGRNGKYSTFTWNHTHFDGCDWDDLAQQSAIYLFKDKSWAEQIDIEMGNYDYLMGADLDFDNPETFQELVNWGKWYLDVTGVDGFRMDAVKHIKFSKILDWILEMRKASDKELFAVGEYWNPHLSSLLFYLDKTAHSLQLFDVPLHYNFHKASTSDGNFDMSKILDGTLVKERPKRAVTLVDNHDTQPGQALESWVASWFKLHAYSLILLRKDGLPCVFYGDLYGISHSAIPPIGKRLEMLLKIRYDLAYGEQVDYFHSPDVVGFTRMGDSNYSHSGLAVIMSDRNQGTLQMCMGESFIGKTMIDALGNCNATIVIGSDGCATFPVNGGSVSVYVENTYLH